MKIKIIAAGITLLTALAALAGDEAPLPPPSKHASLLGSPRFAAQDGETLFKSVCAACHMPNATGGSGAGFYPALAKNDKLAVSAYPVMMVMSGRRAMPGFGNELSDVQIANVVNYLRTHFGNHYKDVVTPAFVASARPASMKMGSNAREHQ